METLRQECQNCKNWHICLYEDGGNLSSKIKTKPIITDNGELLGYECNLFEDISVA